MSDGGEHLTQGGQGELLDARRPRQHMAMMRRAIREGWPISQGVKAAIIHEMTAIATSSIHVCYDDQDRDDLVETAVRNKIAAAKVIVAADAVNVSREKMDQADDHAEKGLLGGGLNLNIGVAVTAGIQKATQEPEYLEWLRERGLAGRGDADAVGANGFRAELPDATSHLGFRPGDNGHDSGA